MSEKIDQLVAERRAALGRKDGVEDKWGLALSGGGIRSATFAFGLLGVLARNRLLERFDLLSTVSGGGYIGGMLGRLLQRASSAADTRAIFAAFGAPEPRWFRWWLRANGRYLVPRGPADRTFAFAIFLRNLLAIHLDLGALALALGVVLAMVDAAVWAAIAQWVTGGRIEAVRWLPLWLPTLWPLAIPLLAMLGGLATVAYWVVPWVASAGRPGWRPSYLAVQWGILAIACGLLVGYRDTLIGPPGQPGHAIRMALTWGTIGLATAWLLAIPWARFLLRHLFAKAEIDGLRLREEAVRRWLADWQSMVMKAIAVVLLVGLVDRAAWFLAFEFKAQADTALALAVAAAVLRAAMPALGGGARGGMSGKLLLSLGQFAGYLLGFLLCAWWVSLVHAAALGPMFATADKVDFGAPWLRLFVIGAAAGGYVLATGRNFEFLNLSSLHTFYRARLVRSYLGAANPARFVQQAPLGPIGVVSENGAAHLAHKSVFAPDPGDDLAMEAYAPHRQGGPVHLIGVCINQTRDPRGGLFNRDRRGLPLTVGPRGWMRVGLGPWEKMEGRGALSLGSWVAISGAAVSPGLGSQTRGGISAVLAFAGIRLGYWWTRSAHENLQRPARRLAGKSRGLLSEVFCNFKGSTGPNWFLSDGGHFENTAAYALLAEHCRMIVLADCGADPEYRFGDLENLVRKARIDLGAEIEFLRPRPRAEGEQRPAGVELFGSLNELASRKSNACLALARVRYKEAAEPGWLVLVKPNISAGLPVDLINFAASNPTFPQQTTADQFFDEAQWESYYQLGFKLGEALDIDLLEALRSRHATLFESDTGALAAATTRIAGTVGTAAAAADASDSRLPERIRNSAVSASIGIGAVATLLVSSWQAVDGAFGAMAEKRKAERDAIHRITELWAKLPGRDRCDKALEQAEPPLLTALAGGFLHHADALCPLQEAEWLAESRLVQEIFDEAIARCRLVETRMRSAACAALLDAQARPIEDRQAWPQICFAKRRADPPAGRQAHYWAYRYGLDAAPKLGAHPGDLVAKSKASAEEDRANARRALCAAPPNSAAAPATPPQQPEPTSAPGPTVPVCSGKTIYVQIHGPDQRDTVRSYRDPWRRLGASVPPIEDVVASARAKQRPPPRPVERTTVRYHDAGSLACASALWATAECAGAQQNHARCTQEKKTAVECWKEQQNYLVCLNKPHWNVEPLAPSLKPTLGVIEVWIGPDVPAKAGEAK